MNRRDIEIANLKDKTVSLRVLWHKLNAKELCLSWT